MRKVIRFGLEPRDQDGDYGDDEQGERAVVYGVVVVGPQWIFSMPVFLLEIIWKFITFGLGVQRILILEEGIDLTNFSYYNFLYETNKSASLALERAEQILAHYEEKSHFNSGVIGDGPQCD